MQAFEQNTPAEPFGCSSSIAVEAFALWLAGWLWLAEQNQDSQPYAHTATHRQQDWLHVNSGDGASGFWVVVDALSDALH